MGKKSVNFSKCRVPGCRKAKRCLGISQFESDLEIESTYPQHAPMDKFSAEAYIKKCGMLGCRELEKLGEVASHFKYNQIEQG